MLEIWSSLWALSSVFAIYIFFNAQNFTFTFFSFIDSRLYTWNIWFSHFKNKRSTPLSCVPRSSLLHGACPLLSDGHVALSPCCSVFPLTVLPSLSSALHPSQPFSSLLTSKMLSLLTLLQEKALFDLPEYLFQWTTPSCCDIKMLAGVWYTNPCVWIGL